MSGGELWEWFEEGGGGLAVLKKEQHKEALSGYRGRGEAETVPEGREFLGQKAKREPSHEESSWKGDNIERWSGSCGELELDHNVVGATNWFDGSWLGGRNESSREEVRILAPAVDSSPEIL